MDGHLPYGPFFINKDIGYPRCDFFDDFMYTRIQNRNVSQTSSSPENPQGLSPQPPPRGTKNPPVSLPQTSSPEEEYSYDFHSETEGLAPPRGTKNPPVSSPQPRPRGPGNQLVSTPGLLEFSPEASSQASSPMGTEIPPVSSPQSSTEKYPDDFEAPSEVSSLTLSPDDDGSIVNYEEEDKNGDDNEIEINAATKKYTNGDVALDYTKDFNTLDNISKYSKNLREKLSNIVDINEANKYKVIENVGGGDCFYLAFLDSDPNITRINKQPKLQELRKILSNSNTDNYFTDVKDGYTTETNKYNKYFNEVSEYINYLITNKDGELDISTIPVSLSDYSDFINVIHKRQSYSPNDYKTKLEKFLVNFKKSTRGTHEWYWNPNFKDILYNNNNFKGFMRTKYHWAESIDIQMVEKIYNVKFIILYSPIDVENIQIVFSNGDFGKKTDNITYIMLEYNGYHYRLITYNNRTRFKFREVPLLIKILVVKKLTSNFDNLIIGDDDKYTYEFEDYISNIKMYHDIYDILQSEDYKPKFKDELFNEITEFLKIPNNHALKNESVKNKFPHIRL